MNAELHIRVLSDGKPGHLNQSLGLVEAIKRIRPANETIEQVSPNSWRRLMQNSNLSPQPDLILAAGHATHLRLIQLARKYAAIGVVLMKPSLPRALFDLCVIPGHDLKTRQQAANQIITRGVLNRVPPPDPDQTRRSGLILIGGPSSAHGWMPEQLIEQVQAIVAARGERPWRVTDSRRTPPDFLDQLRAACPALVAHPHAETGDEWLPQRLAEAAEVWVTEDSVSMIYEALSSGAAVGLLSAPRKTSCGRVLRGLDQLIEEHWATPYDAWDPGQPLTPPPHVLREADRVADELLRQFFT